MLGSCNALQEPAPCMRRRPAAVSSAQRLELRTKAPLGPPRQPRSPRAVAVEPLRPMQRLTQVRSGHRLTHSPRRSPTAGAAGNRSRPKPSNQPALSTCPQALDRRTARQYMNQLQGWELQDAAGGLHLRWGAPHSTAAHLLWSRVWAALGCRAPHVPRSHPTLTCPAAGAPGRPPPLLRRWSCAPASQLWRLARGATPTPASASTPGTG